MLRIKTGSCEIGNWGRSDLYYVLYKRGGLILLYDGLMGSEDREGGGRGGGIGRGLATPERGVWRCRGD